MFKFKESIKAITPYAPGKPVKEVERELGILNPLKLASNENAWGFSPKVKKAMEETIKEANIYPDGNSFYLRKRIAEFHNVHIDNVMTGNGSNEVIEIVMRTVLDKGYNTVASEYSFAIYKIITQACGAEYRATKAKKNYQFDADAIIKACDKNTAIIVIDNPNNPTGTYLPVQEMLKIAKFAKENSIMLISDEAYVEYIRAKDYSSMMDYLKDFDNLVVTRTYSKAYGMAGLRLGYAVANKEIIDICNRIREAFNVGIITQHAGIAALDDQDFVKEVVKKTHEGIDYIYGALEEMGLKYIPTECNFILVEVPHSSVDSFNKLLRSGIIVRPLHGYGLNNHIRLSVGSMEENKKAIEAIRSHLK